MESELNPEGYANFRAQYAEAAASIVAQIALDLPGQIRELEQALSRRDHKALRGIAHTFKSHCWLVGAEGLADFCQKVENQAADPDHAADRAHAMLQRFQALVEDLQKT